MSKVFWYSSTLLVKIVLFRIRELKDNCGPNSTKRSSIQDTVSCTKILKIQEIVSTAMSPSISSIVQIFTIHPIRSGPWALGLLVLPQLWELYSLEGLVLFCLRKSEVQFIQNISQPMIPTT